MSLAQLNDFSIIKVTGEDAFSFLQGQVTCDVNTLKETPVLPGCHCNAKGKMWSTFIAIYQDDAIYLIAAKESAAASLKELNKYGVFAKADITDDSENWFVYGGNGSSDEGTVIQLSEEHSLVLSQQALTTDDAFSAQDWWQSEINSGRAHLFANTIEEFVPQMLNMQALDYISFNKGCYMGQEMVARMRYLGKNKRALYLSKTSSDVSLTAGDDVAIELNGNKRNVGKVINSVVNNGQTFAQLVLPKDTELTQTLFIGDNTFELQPLPYQLEEQE